MKLQILNHKLIIENILAKEYKLVIDICTCHFTLTIRVLPIQKVSNLTNDSAFVLPANNSFADDCITDGKSALGAFFKEHHSEKIMNFKERIKKILTEQSIFPIKGDLFKPATAIILPDEYSIKAKVILVASSVRNDGKGFYTNPSIICDSIYNVFEKTADKKINTFYFPIIGSGHAGLETTEALNLMLLFIKFHTKQFHHVKNITIFVLENDIKKIKANFLNSL